MSFMKSIRGSGTGRTSAPQYLRALIPPFRPVRAQKWPSLLFFSWRDTNSQTVSLPPYSLTPDTPAIHSPQIQDPREDIKYALLSTRISRLVCARLVQGTYEARQAQGGVRPSSLGAPSSVDSRCQALQMQSQMQNIGLFSSKACCDMWPPLRTHGS